MKAHNPQPHIYYIERWWHEPNMEPEAKFFGRHMLPATSWPGIGSLSMLP